MSDLRALYRCQQHLDFIFREYLKVPNNSEPACPLLRLKQGKRMKSKYLEKRNVTPEKAVRILRKNGIQVDENQAKKILDFMYLLAKLVVREYLSDDENQ